MKDSSTDRQSTAAAAQHNFRARHRAMQHQSAHADTTDQPTDKIISHPLVPTAAGELITSAAALVDLVDHLRAQRSFAYDSEFIGELSYYPRLCLIQAATTQRIGLIDPMAELDLNPFWELLCDPSIEKIVHAGEQDIEPVHRLTKRPAANVFDTQIAAGFAGLAYPVGLSKLVMELVGARLGKGLTFTHWDQRPLTPLQLKYAADDVRYLPAIGAELRKRLQTLGHADWATEESNSLCDPGRYGFNPQTHFLKIRGANGLTSQGLAVLRELTIWRDSTAKAHDIPARAFLKDDILLDMARSPIKSIEKLARVKGLPRPVEAAHGAAIVEATMRGLAIPVSDRPTAKTREPTPSERFGADSLYALVSALCAGRSIDPALVASRQDIAELYWARAHGEDAVGLPLLNGWRYQACGKQLLELLQGDGNVQLSWQAAGLRASFKAPIIK